MKDQELALRKAIIHQAQWMNNTGLNQGTSGNISVRLGDEMLITPSAIPYNELTPPMITSMPLHGVYGSWNGPHKPSTEWRFHLDILRAREHVNAVVHTHSTYATVLAIAGKEIPAAHYMVAAFGGNNIRCAPYARYGTKALSDHALKALENRLGCLLANHGMITAGPSLDKAMWLAVELETLAKQYYLALSLGDLVLLSDAEIEDTLAAFSTYGVKHSKKR
ncbi:MAG: class II aldolase/adducin family protein [Rhodothermales bacterium]